MPLRRKCFISYHHADQAYVDAFVRTFDHQRNLLIARGLGAEMTNDVINSTDTDYVMSRIRQLYLSDSTVTIVLIGQCTWARRYVDWEIQASLRSGATGTPNGLLGIRLSTFTQFPERFNSNLDTKNAGGDRNYAGWIDYPQTEEALVNAIEWAFQRRTTHANQINNVRDRMGYNRQCP
jgi:hypothetical protein